MTLTPSHTVAPLELSLQGEELRERLDIASTDAVVEGLAALLGERATVTLTIPRQEGRLALCLRVVA